MGVFKSNKEKVITYIVFALYLLILCWLVLFKLATSINMIPSMRGINVIPFYYDEEVSFHTREVLFNAIVFVPAGFYFSAIFSNKSIWLGTAASAILSLFFEAVQWIFSIGASDITDIITNTIGGLCGMIIWGIMGKLISKHRMTIANIIGTIVEIASVFFLILKIALN